LQIAEPSARTMMMLNGEAQIGVQLPSEDLELFMDNPEFVQFHHQMPNPFPIHFNMTDPITSDKNFRLAVAHCVNATDIAMANQRYFSLPDDGVMGPYFMPFRDSSIRPIPMDIEKAKQYLAASVYNGETLSLTTYLPGALRNTEVFQQQLAAIGIKTEIVQTDPAGLPSMVAWDNNVTQILQASCAIMLNESGMRTMVYPGMLYNRSRYENPRVTELYDKVALEPNREARRDMYYEIQRIVADDIPFFNLYYTDRYVFGAKGLDGFKLTPDVFYDFRYVYQVLD